MAKEKITHILVPGSIYEKNRSERALRVVFSIPEKGMNEQTGILCLLPGYGGSIDSNVYHKMRQQFADQYNMAVLQCDYFGISYMGMYLENSESRYDELVKSGEYTKTYNIIPQETWADCNDMGFMQAMDVIGMILWFIRMSIQQGNLFNTEKTIAYGSSHGCYLSYLVNRLCPGLLKVIIDNSAYILPSYLEDKRKLHNVFEKNENYSYTNVISYLVFREPQMRLPNEFYDLLQLYEDFQNECRIISYHGTNDDMVTLSEKEALINKIGDKASLIPIAPENVDGTIFKTCSHGLGIDLIALYQITERFVSFDQNTMLSIPNTVILNGLHDRIEITYECLQPNFHWYKF